LKVVILGAGITGLSTAMRLAELSDFEVLVIEREPTVGGICRTFKEGEFSFDYGPHKIYSQNERIISGIKNLCGEELLTLPRKSRIRLMGGYFNYPLEVKDLLLTISPLKSMRFGFSYFYSKAKARIKPCSDDSYEGWVVNRFGRAIYETVFGPYAQKIWGIDPAKTSSDLAKHRISIPDLKEVLLGFIFPGRKKQPSLYASQFLYPQRGIQYLSDALKERTESLGRKIILSTEPVRIKVKDSAVGSVVYKQNEREVEMECSHLVSTIPITELFPLFEPSPPSEVFSCVDALSFRSLILLYLILGKERVSSDCWLYFPEKDFIFNRVFEQKNFSSVMAPPGKTGLCVEISCDVGNELWNATDDEIFERTIGDLEKTELIRREEVTSYFTKRIRYAYPKYTLDYRKYLLPLLEYLQGFENLIPNGRQGLFRYNNMDHSIEMGFLAADHIIAGKSRDDWNQQLKRFEDIKIID